MVSRRDFVGTALAATAAPTLAGAAPTRGVAAPDRFDPWIEVDPAALRDNVTRISSLTHGRPVLAVIKNNAYGLGLTTVARILEPMTEVFGFAVVKPEAALALREAGLIKPVLVMGLFDLADGVELASQDIELSASSDDARARLEEVAARIGRPVRTHFYLDSGMGRMGIPTHRALPWMADLAESRFVDIRGSYMAFTEETDFDGEQLGRFLRVRDDAAGRGIEMGRLHAASSNGVYHLPDAHLDLVRPGIAIFGAYPSRPAEERALGELRCALSLKARVVRVERLRVGDSVSYGRNYVAERPVWTATLPAGHVDGVPRGAVNGMTVMINDRLYPIIGAVSASHCIIEVGDEPTVAIGDTATIIGPDRAALEPNAIAAAAGISVYDVLMHLNPGLPRIVV